MWKSLDFPLINFKIELDLKWTRNYGLIEEDDNITGTTFTITSTKIIFQLLLCLLVITLNFGKYKARI